MSRSSPFVAAGAFVLGGLAASQLIVPAHAQQPGAKMMVYCFKRPAP